MNNQITSYITEAKASGLSKEQIRDNLIKAGWDPMTIDAILNGEFTQVFTPKLANSTDTLPKKSSKLVLVILIIALLLIIIGATVYYFAIYKTKSVVTTSDSNPSSQKSATTSSKYTLVDVKTTDGKDYYSFERPNEWVGQTSSNPAYDSDYRIFPSAEEQDKYLARENNKSGDGVIPFTRNIIISSGYDSIFNDALLETNVNLSKGRSTDEGMKLLDPVKFSGGIYRCATFTAANTLLLCYVTFNNPPKGTINLPAQDGSSTTQEIIGAASITMTSPGTEFEQDKIVMQHIIETLNLKLVK